MTGASSGCGAITVRAVVDARHPVYAGRYAREPSVDLRVVELDVSGQTSVDSPIVRILQEAERA